MSGFLKSFVYALNGIIEAIKQRNIKIQLTIAIAAIALGFIFHINRGEWCIILLCIALVLSLEITNTALEHLVDLVSPDYHEKAGKIKDLAAGAVLIASIISAIIGLIIFGKYLLSLL